MKITCTTLFVATALCLSAGLAQAQDDSPQITPVEFFPCTFNDGKGMADLQKVITKWNAFMDDNDAAGYQAWLLMPNFVSGDNAAWHVGWLGAWPSGKAMGESLNVWHGKGGDMQKAFDEVVSCAAHINYAVMQMKDVDREPSDQPVLTFSNCTADRKANMDAAFGAVREWIDYESAQGIDSPHWVFFPGYGEPQESDYDFKWVTGYKDYAAFGREWDAYANEGGWQKAQDVFRGTLDCDNPRVYTVKRVRGNEGG
jgi:hypothetical protein